MPPAAQSAPAPFAPEAKKGEVNELRGLLRAVASERGQNLQKRRDVMKKVVAYMTLGYDCARLFPDVVMVSSTQDLIIKKMSYLYLSNYARSNPELTTLCINTLSKDCRDSDPMVRGLALRTLSSLRLPSIVEYILPSMKAGLKDASPYVRRNAVMAVLKVQHLSAELVRESDLIDTLYDMLRDRDSKVVTSCLVVLREIMLEEGGIAINQSIVHHLLNRIKEFDEWGQSVVLELLPRYRPADPNETFAIMNILDACLRVSNSAVVLSAAKCFMRYAETMREIRNDVYTRLKQPMLTLTASASHEVRYVVLRHVSLVVSRCPSGIFDDEFKQFYCHYNEPSHVRYIKLEILPELANEDNVAELVAELAEYVSDVDQEMARRSLNAIGRIAVKIPPSADSIINQLLDFLEIDISYVRAEVACVVKNLLRKYPDRFADVKPALALCLQRIEDPRGRAAVVWMIGEFGHLEMPRAPYLLEKLVDAYSEEPSTEVRMALLTSVTKLFFRRPPECQRMLGRLLDRVLNDTSDSDLHDRGLLYYRLLRHDPAEAARIVGCPKEVITTFTEERDAELKQVLFEQFNTLAVVYNRPADQYVPMSHREAVPGPAEERVADAPLQPAQPMPEVDAVSAAAESGVGDLLGGFAGSAPASVQTPAPSGTTGEDLLGDLLSMSSSEAPTPSPASPAVVLQPNCSLEQNTFQSSWGSLGVSATLEITLPTCPAAVELESAAAKNHIYCMASGDLGAQLKFYFYGIETNGSIFLSEVLLVKGSGLLTATFKSTDESKTSVFAELFRGAIATPTSSVPTTESLLAF